MGHTRSAVAETRIYDSGASLRALSGKVGDLQSLLLPILIAGTPRCGKEDSTHAQIAIAPGQSILTLACNRGTNPARKAKIVIHRFSLSKQPCH
jgi:hypothetical protein